MVGSLPSGAGVAGQPSRGDLRTQAELRLVCSCAAVATVSRFSHPVQRQMGAGWLRLHPVWNLCSGDQSALQGTLIGCSRKAMGGPLAVLRAGT